MSDIPTTPAAGNPGGPIAADPGNADPDEWSAPFTADELADLLALADNPQDPLELAALAGTLYDPELEGATGGEA